MEDRSIKYKKALETICFSSYSKPQRSSPQAKVKPSPKPKVPQTNSAKKKLAPKPSRKVREISVKEESEDKGPASGKRKREVCRVLKSFNASPGFGDSLKKLLPKDFKHYSDEVACLLLSINERQNIWFSKYHHGEELTENEVMST